MDINGSAFLPGQPEWFISRDENITTAAAAAVSRNSFVISVQLEGRSHDLSDNHSRFYRYDDSNWVCVKIDRVLTGLTRYRDVGWTENGLACLGREGDVWLLNDQSVQEHVAGPGRQLDFRLGFMTGLKAIGGDLYAFGMGAQLYRRVQGGWAPDDAGMRGIEPSYPRKRSSEQGETAWLTDFVSVDNDTYYACGSISLSRPALFTRQGEKNWDWVTISEKNSDLDFHRLDSILPDSDNSIWISTNRGVLLRGNAASGFRPATSIAADPASPGSLARLASMARFNGSIYVASSAGLLRLRDDLQWETVQASPALPSLEYISGERRIIGGKIQVVDGTLWVFARTVHAKFDGTSWERIVMPSPYR